MSSDVRDEHPSNILLILPTLLMLNELRSRDVRDEHPLNIYHIS